MNKRTEPKPYWSGHRERLRQRAVEEGFDALRPYEVIEILLGYVMPRVDLSDVSRALVVKFGSLDGVLKADRRGLMSVPGMTRRMADWLLATGEVLMAYNDVDQEARLRIWRFQDLLNFLKYRWRELPAPQTWAIYTDYDDRLLSYMKLGDSLDFSSTICSRELMENAMVLEARYVYLVGLPGMEPLELYPEEIGDLETLSEALLTIDVRLMDCVLVGEAGFMSMCQEGYLDAARQNAIMDRLRERYLGEDDEGMDSYEGYSPVFEGL